MFNAGLMPGDYSSLIKGLHDNAESGTGHYTDRGYGKDQPPIHTREGY
jgi:hypothetical protein